MNECVEVGDVPGWLVEGRTILVMKDSTKGTEVGKYIPTACFNLIWKLLAVIISDKTYDHLEKNTNYHKNKKELEESAKGQNINLRWIDTYCKIAGKERQI